MCLHMPVHLYDCVHVCLCLCVCMYVSVFAYVSVCNEVLKDKRSRKMRLEREVESWEGFRTNRVS